MRAGSPVCTTRPTMPSPNWYRSSAARTDSTDCAAATTNSRPLGVSSRIVPRRTSSFRSSSAKTAASNSRWPDRTANSRLMDASVSSCCSCFAIALRSFSTVGVRTDGLLRHRICRSAFHQARSSPSLRPSVLAMRPTANGRVAGDRRGTAHGTLTVWARLPKNGHSAGCRGEPRRAVLPFPRGKP